MIDAFITRSSQNATEAISSLPLLNRSVKVGIYSSRVRVCYCGESVRFDSGGQRGRGQHTHAPPAAETRRAAMGPRMCEVIIVI